MNLSRQSNSYSFKDFSNDMFKVQSLDQAIYKRISDSLKQYGDLPNVRLINDWMLLIIRNSMRVWKYTCFQKNHISAPKEYFLPNSEILYSANQGLIICDNVSKKPLSCIIVGDDAIVRFWPNMTSTKEYIDQKIPNIYNDKCILVEKINNDVLIFMFKSMKFVIADLKEYTDVGISFKQFTQPTGLIGGISRCLTSFFTTSYTNVESPFVALKINNQMKEDSELLILVDNNIDTLCLDVLLNGKYTKAIFNHTVIKKAISEKFINKFPMHLDNWNFTIRNFDFRRDIFYILLEINQFGSNVKTFIMVTYNRRLELVDSVAEINNSQFEGDIEILVIDDEIPIVDQPCLISTVKDNHTISIVEVLTGDIKAKFDAHDCLRSSNSAVVHSTKSILCWTCPKFSEDSSIKVVILTTCKQLVSIKQNINPFYKDTSKRLLETNLSNASLQDINYRKFRGINQQGDVDMSNISFSHKTMNPMSLSTPKTKLDQMGDRFAEDSNLSLNQINLDKNQSVNFDDNIDQLICEKSTFGKFKNCLILYWLGYKSQANRLLASLIEASQIDSEVSIPHFVLEIAREIIDEHPIKDPRWLKVKSQPYNNNFCYSTKSLILSQQLASKRAALQNLLMMLHDNKVDLFGAVCNVAPISVYKSLLQHGEKSSLQIFGDCQVSWPLVNCIGLGGELLEFVDVLNKIMVNNQCVEMQTILNKTCQNILSIQKKLSPMDIISQEVSLIPTFINECCDYLNGIRDGMIELESNASEQITDFNKIFHLIAEILFKCLQASLNYRKEFENSFLAQNFRGGHAHQSSTAPCWVTENQPIGVSDAINNLIVNLIDFARNSESNQLFDLGFNIITIYLEFYQHRHEWMENYSTNDSESDRLLEEYRQNRYYLINKIVEDGKNINKGLELADVFMDFHWIIALCEVIDNESGDSKSLRLEYYLHKFCEEGFSEYVLNWYQDKMKEKIIPQKGKLLAKIQIILEKIQKIEGTNMSTRMENSNSTVVISKFLDKTEDQTTRWLHEIEIEDFGQAANTLMRSGESEKASLGRKKALLSLAKLSCLAGIDDVESKDVETMLNTANVHLKLISFQEDIPPKFVNTLLGYSPDVSTQPLLEVEKLVKLYLESATSEDNNDNGVKVQYIVSALYLLYVAREHFTITKLSDSQYNDLLLIVWSKAILLDINKWINISSENLGSTVISLVINAAAKDSEIPIENLLPNIDQLCSHELLKDKISDLEMEFHIKQSFEALTAHFYLSPENNSSMVY